MSLDEMINFVRLSENLLTSGQPDEDDFREAAQAGVQAVINLARPDSDFALPNEAEIVRALGMDYVHIPVDWENPTRQKLEQFWAEMEAREGQKLLVHCALNYRVSAFTALWKALKLGEEPGKAFQHVHEIWEPKDYPIWDDFIRHVLADGGIDTPSL
ncbi:MAG: hypothetical protein Kow002_15640 [Anaerolineales bacterium]